MKFVLVVICAMILVASSQAQVISLGDLLRAYDISNNEIGDGGKSVKVANEVLFIPMSKRSCTPGGCTFVCRLLGYKYGTCRSSGDCQCSN